jgi:hypothetical protein
MTELLSKIGDGLRAANLPTAVERLGEIESEIESINTIIENNHIQQYFGTVDPNLVLWVQDTKAQVDQKRRALFPAREAFSGLDTIIKKLKEEANVLKKNHQQVQDLAKGTD